MTNKIGVLHIDDHSPKEDYLNELTNSDINNQNFILMKIKEKKQVSLLDGLVIKIEKASDYIKVFQWLIDLKDEYPLFIWVLCGKEESEFSKLYPQLCNNSIIQVLKEDVSLEMLGILIKNALNYKNQLLDSSEEKKVSSDIFLDTSKMSLEVYDISIMLTRKEFRIIELLYRNLGNVVTYQEMSKVISEDLLDEVERKYRIANFIFHIRNKLKKQNYFRIEIIRTKGYVLTCSEITRNFTLRINEKLQ